MAKHGGPTGDGEVRDFDPRRSKPVEEAGSGKHSTEDKPPEKDE